MRDLAAEAGLSFATPFNQFGSKAAIMHALSAERIGAMTDRFVEADPQGDTADRVLKAVEIAVAVMLDSPAVNRAIISTIGAPGGSSGAYANSRALWRKAIGAGQGLDVRLMGAPAAILAEHLTVAFRGALSFWTAEELTDAQFRSRALGAAAALLLGFVTAGPRRDRLMELAAAGS